MSRVEDNLNIIAAYKASSGCVVCDKKDSKNRIVDSVGNPSTYLMKLATTLESKDFEIELKKYFIICDGCKLNKTEANRKTNREIILEHKRTHGCAVCGEINEKNWIMSPSGKTLGFISDVARHHGKKRLLEELDRRVVICESCAYTAMGRQTVVVTKRTVREAIQHIMNDLEMRNPKPVKQKGNIDHFLMYGTLDHNYEGEGPKDPNKLKPKKAENSKSPFDPYK